MRLFWIVMGSVCLLLGTIGLFMPFLPTVPFYLATAYAYGHSSQRLCKWFKGSRLYRENLADFERGCGLTKRAKVKILISVSLLMGFGFYMMKNTFWGRMVLLLVWLAHVLMILFRVKTKEN